MQGVGLEEVGKALLITGGFVVVSITIVVLVMLWVHKVFKEKDRSDEFPVKEYEDEKDKPS